MNFFTFFENDFLVVLPELFISIAIIFLLSYGVIYSTSEYYKTPALAVNVSWLSFFVLGIAFILCVNNFLSSISDRPLFSQLQFKQIKDTNRHA